MQIQFQMYTSWKKGRPSQRALTTEKKASFIETSQNTERLPLAVTIATQGKSYQWYYRAVTICRGLIIGSAEALPILCVRYFWWEREREIQTERDGSDVTIVALKLAMNLHFPLPKSRRWAYTSLAKNSPKIRTFCFSLHTSRLSLRREVTILALKFAMSSHFPLPKSFSPSRFVPLLSNGTSRATSDRKPKTNDQILPSPIFLPIEKMNQINTKNYWK